MQWRVNTNTFGFDVNVKERPLKLRGILSIIGSVFDPFGFAAPYSQENSTRPLQDEIGLGQGNTSRVQCTLAKMAYRPSYAVKACDRPLF